MAAIVVIVVVLVVVGGVGDGGAREHRPASAVSFKDQRFAYNKLQKKTST